MKADQKLKTTAKNIFITAELVDICMYLCNENWIKSSDSPG